MKQFISISLLAIICCGNAAFSQNIAFPPDSLTHLLCKKWLMDYAMMGGTKIGQMPGAMQSNYEFSNDKTFVVTSNANSTKIRGTWSYDQSQKLVKLTINGKSNVSIVSLKSDQLEMLIDSKAATPDDAMPTVIPHRTSAPQPGRRLQCPAYLHKPTR